MSEKFDMQLTDFVDIQNLLSNLISAGAGVRISQTPNSDDPSVFDSNSTALNNTQGGMATETMLVWQIRYNEVSR